MGRANVEVLKNVFEERMEGKAKPVLKSGLKKTNHVGDPSHIGGREVRTPDLHPNRGTITGRE